MKGCLSCIHWYLSSKKEKKPGHVITSDQEEPGLTPAANTSISVCVCVCVPAVIITRIRAEPNPRRVPPLFHTARPGPAAWSPLWGGMGSWADIQESSKNSFFLHILTPLRLIDLNKKHSTFSGNTKTHNPFSLDPQGCSEMEANTAVNMSVWRKQYAENNNGLIT